METYSLVNLNFKKGIEILPFHIFFIFLGGKIKDVLFHILLAHIDS
jgi:hypothetical protein